MFLKMKPCYSNFLRIAVEKDDFTHLVRMILVTGLILRSEEESVFLQD